MPSIPGQHVPTALWRTVIRLDRSKISPSIAIRNAAAIALPLAVGTALNVPLAATAVATGALNVAFSDGYDPYAQRARRMLSWSVLGGVAVFIGAATGGDHITATLVAAIWAFVAGMLIAVNTRAGDLGLNTLVTVIVFASRPLSVQDAVYAGLLVFAGGVLQTGFALLLWPLRRRRVEREAVGQAYMELAEAIHPDADAETAAFLQAPPQAVQDTLDALGRDHSIEGERYRLLFDQANRIRVSAFALRYAMANWSDEAVLQQPRRALLLASKIAASLGECMRSGAAAVPISAPLEELTGLARCSRKNGLPERLSAAMEALAAQLRVVSQLTVRTVGDELPVSGRRELPPAWSLPISSWIDTLRANLDFGSAFFRHALRMSVCVAAADAIGRSVDWNRTYWIPMTVAVILKPDFGSTFSRGALRLLGTFSGLVIATVLYHVFPQTPWTLLLLVGAFALMLRWIGPANYGVFSAAVAGLVVFLIAATGIAPIKTVTARGINTAAGGLIALVAYAVWPTWERVQIRQRMAEMLDRCREYLQTVALRLERDDEELDAALENARLNWRLARSNAEASVDRFSGEPGATPERLGLMNSMLASSHAVVYSVMVLEAELRHLPQTGAYAMGRAFLHDAEFMLYFLAAALRGVPSAMEGLPDLRKSRLLLMQSREGLAPGDDFLSEETNRLTVSLNTLREQVEQFNRDPVGTRAENG
jgi:uncharacterized membrane protein YccC